MKTMAKGRIIGIFLVISLLCLTPAMADEELATGAAAASGGAGASADLDFEINIPSFIYFRVGAGAAVETVTFSPSAADVAAQNPQGPTAVQVRLISNVGDVRITEATGGALTDGGVNTISYGTIATTFATINAPVLSDGANNFVDIASAGGIINLTDNWNYTFTPPATPPVGGTYTGTVTYTAAVP